MCASSEGFVHRLVQDVPDLQPLLESHLADNDELLSHVLMGDVVKWVVSALEKPQLQKGVQRVLDLLEEALEGGDPDLQDLVLVWA